MVRTCEPSAESSEPLTEIAGRLPRRGDTVVVTLDAVSDDGVATGTLSGWLDAGRTPAKALIEARGGLPGDRAEVAVTARGGGVVSGRVSRLLEASPDRVDPACPHAADEARDGTGCGGCTLQGLRYEAQRGLKRQRVVRALEAAGVAAEVAEIVGAEVRFGHRHKMEFSFGRSGPRGDAASELVLGLHPRGRRWEVLALSTCAMLSTGAFDVAARVREAAAALGLRARDDRDGSGWLETLTLRESRRADRHAAADDGRPGLAPYRLVELTTAEVEWVETSDGPVPAAQVAHALGAVAAACDGVIGVVWTERRAARGVPTRRTTRLLSGSGVLPERLAAPGPTAGERRLLDLDVSPQAFFQPHPLQAEVLIARIAARLASEARTLGRGLRLADLYCGTGTLGLALSGVVARLVGVELVAEAVEDARRNAARNYIENASFVAGDVGQIIADPAFGHLFADLDAVIVDPPRAGLMPQAASHLARLTPRLIVYVSCNPAALARDLPVLAGLGYRLDGPLTPVDLFPQTHHVETLAFLVRSSDPAAGSAE